MLSFLLFSVVQLQIRLYLNINCKNIAILLNYSSSLENLSWQQRKEENRQDFNLKS